MVNKIDGNNYYDYQNLKNVNILDTGEKFSLDYKPKDLQSETKDSKDKSDKASSEQNLPVDKSGVRLELSRQGQTAAAAKAQSLNTSKSQAASGTQSLIDTVRTFISTAIEAVKDFFYKIWNDPQPEDMQVSEDSADFAETLETVEAGGTSGITDTLAAAEMPNSTGADAETAYRMDVERRDREIQKYLRNGDLNQVMSLLTDNGKKEIARNSSLLTYYDKTGRMIEPNASDRERILHGDVNARKL